MIRRDHSRRQGIVCFENIESYNQDNLCSQSSERWITIGDYTIIIIEAIFFRIVINN